MATINVVTTSIFDQSADSIACFVEQDGALSAEALSGITKLFPAYESAKTKHNFVGRASSSLVLSGNRQGKVVDLIIMGLGQKNAQGVVDIERYRRSLGSLVRIVEARKGTSLAVAVPHAQLFGLSDDQLAKQTTIALEMARYHFDEFITDDDRRVKDLKTITLVGSDKSNEALQAGVHEGTIIAQAVNQCRRWIDLPAESLHPIHMATHAADISKKHGLKVTVFNEKEVAQMGMGGLAGVSQGSDRDCQFVIMEYSCGKKDAPMLAFVGKGITFDSGGLSIKPATSMENMKDDMSGAAAVINAMQVLAALKPKVNVVGIAPISENLPSGKAIKPGDILRFYNGKTAEVKNTDAEGRLILADALSYAVKHYKPDAIIDLATLTGSCAAALGPHFTGMMSKHDALVERVQQAAARTGEQLWRLPLPDEYKVAIKSSVADMSNIGSQRYMAGAVTAALFLQNFVGDVPWVHLDIAGTAYDVPDIAYYRPEGATGVGVRLLVELAMNWK